MSILDQYQLRPGLEIHRLGPRRFLVVDPATRKHVELGPDERYLVHMVREARSVEEVLDGYRERFGKEISRQQLIGFLENLRILGLTVDGAESAGSPATPFEPVMDTPGTTEAKEPKPVLNFCFDVLTLLFGWLVHPIWMIPILWASYWALICLINHWHDYLTTVVGVVHTYSAIPVLVASYLQTLVFINFPRAVMTGIACRRYGGYIRKFGLTLYKGIIPSFICEVGDSLLSMSERGRWTVLSIDIWCQLAIGAFSGIAWALCGPRLGIGIFWAYLLLPCLLGLAMNSLIFYESHGYWILCYALEEYRLSERALAETSAWLNGRPPPEALTRKQRYWFRFYGLSSYIFKLLIESTFWLIAGIWLFHTYKGPGAIAFFVAIVWFYHDPIERNLMQFSAIQWLVRWGGAWWVRWSIRIALLPGFILLGFIPYSHELVGECRLQPFVQHGIRAQLSDEIEQIHISEGQCVEPGTLIATLVGRNARANVAVTEAELEAAKAELELLVNGPRQEDIAVAKDTVELRENMLNYQESKYARTEILHSRKMASPSEFEKARTDRDDARLNLLTARLDLAKLTAGYREESIKAAKAKVKQSEEELKRYKEMITLTEIYTPVGGIVSLPYMEEHVGQATSPGDLIAIVQDSSRLGVEVAIDDAATVYLKEGMLAKVRLHGLYGQLLTGRVSRVAPAAEMASKYGNTPIRSDAEFYKDQMANSRFQSPDYHLRIYVDLDEPPPDLLPEMTGYARIVVNEDDVFWRALARPVVRFLRTEVWSWLP
jgi:multidrug resistance efflux pump